MQAKGVSQYDDAKFQIIYNMKQMAGGNDMKQ